MIDGPMVRTVGLGCPGDPDQPRLTSHPPVTPHRSPAPVGENNSGVPTVPTKLNISQHYDAPAAQVFALFGDHDFIESRLHDAGGLD